MDEALISEGVRMILAGVGEDPERDGLRDTPARVARSMAELCGGYEMDPKDILAAQFDGGTYNAMVVLREVDFFSLCEHHTLVFHGVASLAYIPRARVVGLSKLARLVECFARRLQIQERMTSQIGEALQEHLNPIGWGVEVRAQHMCMAARGVGKQRSEMVTTALGGAFLSDSSVRTEFLSRLTRVG